MNKLLAVLLLAFFVGAAFGADRHLQAKFTKWMRENNKIYPSSEFQQRFATWTANYEWVEEFNKRADVSFTVAVNGFADLANEEFNTLFKGLKRIEVTIPEDISEDDTSALPASVDWRTKGVVTGIKNQGQCGPAGRSRPPVPLRVPMPSTPEPSSPSRSRTWSIARLRRATRDATAV